MPDTLRSLLVCPLTKQHLLPLDSKRARLVQHALEKGELRYVDGAPVDASAGQIQFLITENAHHLYSVIDSVPLLFENRQVDLSSLGEA